MSLTRSIPTRMVRAKVAGSGVLLLATAALHGTGYPTIASKIAGSSLPAELVTVMGGLWVFFSWHLAVVGIAAIFAAVAGSVWLRPALFFCGAVALIDFLFVFRLTGWFPGTVLMLLAALGLLVGAYLWSGK